MTRAEYLRLVNTAKEKKNERLSLILQTICGMGIRVSELQFITVEAAKREFATVSHKCGSNSVSRPSLDSMNLSMAILYSCEKTSIMRDLRNQYCLFTIDVRKVVRQRQLHNKWNKTTGLADHSTKAGFLLYYRIILTE